MASWSNIKVSSGGEDKKKLSDMLDLLQLKDRVWKKLRFIGKPIAYAEAWIDIRKKDGTKIKIPKFSRDLNPETGEWEDNGCPYRANGIKFRVIYLSNVIDRSAQEDEPKKKKSPTKQEIKSGYKKVGSDTWTPVRVLRIPNSVATRLQGFSETNKKVDKKTGESKVYGIEHKKYGLDVQIKYTKDASAVSMYQTDKGERTKLSDEEKEYLTYDIINAVKALWENPDDSEKNWKSLKKIMITDSKDEEEETSKKKKNKHKHKESEDVEIDEDDIVDIEEIEKKHKKKKKNKHKN